MLNRPHPLFAALACGLCLFSSLALGSPRFTGHTTSQRQSVDESAYLTENATAMDRMMVAMEVSPTGDVDRDFVAMMVPHHQGAIDMAMAVLRYGQNEQIKRLAQEIIVTQQQEIAAMHLAVGAPLPDSTAAPTQSTKPASSHTHSRPPLAEQP